jgi:hypothetical protein
VLVVESVESVGVVEVVYLSPEVVCLFLEALFHSFGVVSSAIQFPK